MLRTQMYLPEDIYERLLTQKQIYNKPMGEIIREILNENLPATKTGGVEGFLALAQLKFRGGTKNLSENYKKLLYAKNSR
jgi:hypothetical protein